MTAVAIPDLASANAVVATISGAIAFSDPLELIAHSEVDAVLIASPDVLLDSSITAVSWHAPEVPSSTGGGLRDPFFLLLHTADGALSTVENSLNARYADAYRLELQEWVSAMSEGRAPSLATR